MSSLQTSSPSAPTSPRRRATDAFVDRFVADPLKITPPSAHAGAVPRPAIVAQLEGSGPLPLVLVTAPAGYGKTTALVQWSGSTDRSVVWVSVDELDNDPVCFLRHLTAALHEVEALPDDVLEPLMRPTPPLTTVVLPRLGRALGQRRRPAIVVLDDVHLLHARDSLDCVEALLTHLPPAWQLVLAGRSTPDLPIGRLRVERRLVELGPSELAMSTSEAADLVTASGLDLDTGQMQQLVDQTEGWPAGLALATLVLRDPSGGTRALATFGGDHRFVAEYLRDELIAVLPDELVQFLLQASVLSRLSGPRCDAVLDRTGSGEILEGLARSKSLFVLPLDDHQARYRFHHLFAELLRGELHKQNPALERELHGRASRLCERDGDIDGAVRHAQAAEDRERAGDLVLAHALELGGHGRNATVGLWLERFDEHEIEDYPPLALAEAWYRLGTGEIELVEHWIAVAGRQTYDHPLPDGLPSLPVGIAMFRALLGRDGVLRTAADAELVRDQCVEGTGWWAMATMLLGAALATTDDRERAQEILQRAARPDAGLPQVRAVALSHLATLDIDADDWAAADLRTAQAIELVERNGLQAYPPIVLAYAIRALVEAHTGRRDDAADHLRHSRRLALAVTQLPPRTTLLVGAALGAVELQLGDPVAARTLLDEAELLARDDPHAVAARARLDRVLAELAIHEQTATTPTPAATGGLGPSSLTTAELRVLEYLPTHLSLKEIGERLYVSRNTVKSHAIATYRKLGVSSRSEAVARATALGLVES